MGRHTPLAVLVDPRLAMLAGLVLEAGGQAADGEALAHHVDVGVPLLLPPPAAARSPTKGVQRVCTVRDNN